MTPLRPAHVGPASAILSVLALGTVFAAAGGLIPSSLVPAAPESVLAAIPHVNVLISLAAIVTIAYGWRAIREGRIDRHRLAMGLAVGLFATFLVLYLYRLVAIGGATPFDGPDRIRQFVYLPLLAIHIGLAVIAIPLVIYALLLTVAHPVGALPRTRHPTVGRVAAALWMISYAMGTGVYLLLHWAYG